MSPSTSAEHLRTQIRKRDPDQWPQALSGPSKPHTPLLFLGFEAHDERLDVQKSDAATCQPIAVNPKAMMPLSSEMGKLCCKPTPLRLTPPPAVTFVPAGQNARDTDVLGYMPAVR